MFAEFDEAALRQSLLWRVYHCWAADGDLLYIGQTWHWTARRWGHITHSPWWREVDNVTFSDRMNHPDALALERQSIRDEAPRHNVKHNVQRVMMSLRQAAS